MRGESRYTGESSCTGKPDPASYPLKSSKIYGKGGPYRIFAQAKGKASDKVLQGSAVEPLKDKAFNSSGSVKTTWNLKWTEVDPPPGK